LRIESNDNLRRITGFSTFTNDQGTADIKIKLNEHFDCSDPVPTFVPITGSQGNAVDCDTTN